MKISLDGKWQLSYRNLDGGECGIISATVPGNIELDLIESGLLPRDIFMGENVVLAEKYETYEWTYTRNFEVEDESKDYRIRFDGVDTVAEYFVNGEKIGSSKNMLVEHVFSLPKLKKGSNEIKVVITPVALLMKDKDISLRLGLTWCAKDRTQGFFRKPGHAFGWDIMPRAISAGIWKSVSVEEIPEHEFERFDMTTYSVNKLNASVLVDYFIKSKNFVMRHRGYTVKVEGECGESKFAFEQTVGDVCGSLWINIPNPKIWTIRNRGQQNLYTVKITLYRDGQKLCCKSMRFGVRTVKLHYSDDEFYFVLNGEKIYVNGTNWVPLNPYHSLDKDKLPYALNKVKESGSNIVRCWGGNVYESDEFFDFMDENGILVWQDFAFGCSTYSQDENDLSEIKDECKKVIRRLRNHASLALWSGDNENDAMYASAGIDPNLSRISREILPQAVFEHDKERTYLPSSPFVSKTNFVKGGSYDYTNCPEFHLWGARDYYKSDFYKTYNAKFVSEMGYHGSVSVESAKRFIPHDELNNRRTPSWALHSTDNHGSIHRVVLMETQIRFMFGDVPEDIERFSLLSQISQAEAYKYFIEHNRCNAKKTGIIWWNLLDGWPQFSDAIIDYYGGEKLAYYNVIRSQNPVLMMIDPDENGNFTLWGVNDTPNAVNEKVTVTDGVTGEVLFSGEVELLPDSKTAITTLRLYSKKRLLLINYENGFNHYISGYPEYDADEYIRWYEIINAKK